MRLVWSNEALHDLEGIADRAPRAAARVFDAVNWLAGQPFPHAFRQVIGRESEHILAAPPYAIFYAVENDTLTVAGIRDSRRRLLPW